MNSPGDCIHLSVNTLLKIHREAVHRFGGDPGIRSRELLESAAAAPQALFDGESVFSDRIEIAAAYLYYLCSNHPFVDGNKRTALAACVVFLKLNGMTPKPDSIDWEVLTVDIASGRINREAATKRLRELLGGQ